MIKVLLVDDSALIRALLSEMINRHPLLHLIGAAKDAYVAKKMVNELSPDVIILDIEMPKVNGLVFLDRLMKAKPTPVLMFSSLTEQGADATITALEKGAVDFLPKPKMDIEKNIREFEDLLIEKVLTVAQAKVSKLTAKPSSVSSAYQGNNALIGMGASTGGPDAIKQVLSALPANCPPILVTQHMPKEFTSAFAKRLNTLCKLNVIEAKDKMPTESGTVYIAPGDFHMQVIKTHKGYRITLDKNDKMNGHRPSVDVMLESIAKHAKEHALGILLTGMGKDGAQGMKNILLCGGHTLAQSERSCVVFGMPKAAVNLDAVNEVIDLSLISKSIASWLAKV